MTFNQKQQRNLLPLQEAEAEEVIVMAKVSERVNEDFVPTTDLISEDGCDTLLLYLPGFKKQQLKVQLTASGILKISGERPIGENKWKRFHKEFRVPSNCDTKGISAKFEGGILYVKQPKLITPAAAEQSPPPQPQPQQEVNPPQPQPQQQAPQEEREPESKRSPRESPKKEEDVPASMRSGEVKDETHGKDEERKGQCAIPERAKRMVCGDNGFFKELMKPENMRKLGVSVLMVVILGFYIVYMFKSLTNWNQEQSVSEYSQEL